VESSDSRGRKAFLTAAGVLGALALVAVAARGSTELGGGAARKPTDALIDIVFTLYLLVMAAGAVLFVYMMVLRRRADLQEGKAPKRRDVKALAILLLLGAVAALAARSFEGWDLPGRPNAEEQPIGSDSTLNATTQALGADPAEARLEWLPVLATLIVFAAGAWAFAGRARRRARGELAPALASDVADAVDESLDDLRAEPDPRRAVIAAYARLERVLAAHGVPRRAAEAPLEYLGRVLSELSVRELAARRLTQLFERARFSHHAVEPEMKERAITALETVRDDLRAARVLAEQEAAAALEAQRSRAAAE
jgi:hypothetical protein